MNKPSPILHCSSACGKLQPQGCYSSLSSYLHVQWTNAVPLIRCMSSNMTNVYEKVGCQNSKLQAGVSVFHETLTNNKHSKWSSIICHSIYTGSFLSFLFDNKTETCETDKHTSRSMSIRHYSYIWISSEYFKLILRKYTSKFTRQMLFLWIGHLA